MNTGHMLLDTSVLSEARRREPEQAVIRFLWSLPKGSIAVPLCAVFELERGASMLRLVDEDRALPLLEWLDALLESDVYVPPMTAEIWRLLARMSIVPAFRKFWFGIGDRSKLCFGCDPGIAAISIHYGMPIATRDVRDFMLIHRHFPLPGLYEPFNDRWHVEPVAAWQPASDGESTRNGIPMTFGSV